MCYHAFIDHYLRALSICLAHRALSEAGFLHGNICPENLVVDREDHTEGILVGFSNALELADSPRSRLLSVGLHGAALDLLQPKPIQPTYDLELESFFWSINHIIQNNRRGFPIISLETARWHQGRLVDMQRQKVGYFHDFVDSHEGEFIAFFRSIGANHEGFFDFITKWQAGLVRARALGHSPPSYDNVISWLQEAAVSYGVWACRP